MMKKWKAELLQAATIQLRDIIVNMSEEEVGLFDIQLIRTTTNNDESITIKTDGATLVQLTSDEVQVEATYNTIKHIK